jgi:hypothetical protein
MKIGLRLELLLWQRRVGRYFLDLRRVDALRGGGAGKQKNRQSQRERRERSKVSE